MPQDMAALAAQYESADAALDPNTARAVFERTAPLQTAVAAFWGLEFLRDIVTNATSVEFDPMDLAKNVQGSIDAHTPCPGWVANAEPDDATQGFIDVTIGVEASRIQRSFLGHATQCRFLAGYVAAPLNVTTTMDLEVDLGRNLGFGDPTPPILVRATNISGTLNNTQINLAQQAISFRLTPDDSVETLVDLATLGVGLSGGVLLAAHEDGTWSMRVRNGDWVCSAQGSQACVFDPA